MKSYFSPILLSLAAVLFLFACKTSQTTQSNTITEKSREDILQSKIDTSAFVSLSPEEIRKATLLAQEMGQIYCSIRRYDKVDMTIIVNQKAVSALRFDSTQLQKKVNALSEYVKGEYDRVLEESTERCRD